MHDDAAPPLTPASMGPGSSPLPGSAPAVDASSPTSPEQLRDHLKAHRLFAHLEDAALSCVVDAMKLHDVEPGHVLVQQGSVDHNPPLWVLASGSMGVHYDRYDATNLFETQQHQIYGAAPTPESANVGGGGSGPLGQISSESVLKPGLRRTGSGLGADSDSSHSSLEIPRNSSSSPGLASLTARRRMTGHFSSSDEQYGIQVNVMRPGTVFDTECTGHLDRKGVAALFTCLLPGHQCNEAYVHELFKAIDHNKDGKVELHEIMTFLHASGTSTGRGRDVQNSSAVTLDYTSSTDTATMTPRGSIAESQVSSKRVRWAASKQKSFASRRRQSFQDKHGHAWTVDAVVQYAAFSFRTEDAVRRFDATKLRHCILFCCCCFEGNNEVERHSPRNKDFSVRNGRATLANHAEFYPHEQALTDATHEDDSLCGSCCRWVLGVVPFTTQIFNHPMLEQAFQRAYAIRTAAQFSTAVAIIVLIGVVGTLGVSPVWMTFLLPLAIINAVCYNCACSKPLYVLWYEQFPGLNPAALVSLILGLTMWITQVEWAFGVAPEWLCYTPAFGQECMQHQNLSIVVAFLGIMRAPIFLFGFSKLLVRPAVLVFIVCVVVYQVMLFVFTAEQPWFFDLGEYHGKSAVPLLYFSMIVVFQFSVMCFAERAARRQFIGEMERMRAKVRASEMLRASTRADIMTRSLSQPSIDPAEENNSDNIVGEPMVCRTSVLVASKSVLITDKVDLDSSIGFPGFTWLLRFRDVHVEKEYYQFKVNTLLHVSFAQYAVIMVLVLINTVWRFIFETTVLTGQIFQMVSLLPWLVAYVCKQNIPQKHWITIIVIQFTLHFLVFWDLFFTQALFGTIGGTVRPIVITCAVTFHIVVYFGTMILPWYVAFIGSVAMVGLTIGAILTLQYDLYFGSIRLGDYPGLVGFASNSSLEFETDGFHIMNVGEFVAYFVYMIFGCAINSLRRERSHRKNWWHERRRKLSVEVLKLHSRGMFMSAQEGLINTLPEDLSAASSNLGSPTTLSRAGSTSSILDVYGDAYSTVEVAKMSASASRDAGHVMLGVDLDSIRLTQPEERGLITMPGAADEEAGRGGGIMTPIPEGGEAQTEIDDTLGCVVLQV